MAILARLRTQAKTEYENTFFDLWTLIKERTERVSRRRQYWICRPLNEVMNRAFDLVEEAALGYFRGQADKRHRIIQKAMDEIESLQEPLIVFWNIEDYDFDKQVLCAELIRKELGLLNGLLPEEERREIKYFTVIDKRAVCKAEFLSNMSNLHKYAFGKIIHADKALKYTESALLAHLTSDALYQVFKANRRIPTTKAEYEIRKECISRAITDLHKMNRPMLAYFNIMEYSENTMREWSAMLCREVALLSNLQRSDKERFKDLI